MFLSLTWLFSLLRTPRTLEPMALHVNEAVPATEHVNLLCQVNKAQISRETRDGREYLIVPSYTLPSDIVMNSGLYPADEIDKAYKALEGTLAPMGHPVVNGQYVSAFTPEAINQFYVGAWNDRAEKVGNRIAVTKTIDIEYAQRTEKGRQLLEAIDKGEPIHTSTGIFLQREMTPNAKGYKWIARNMQMDHDAILIGEIGAATPEQGVGLMVNVADAQELSANEESLFHRFVQWARLNVNSGASNTEPSPEADSMDKEELAALLKTQAETIAANQVEALKPLTDRLEKLEANQKTLSESLTANAKAEEGKMRTVVAAKMGDLIANSLSGDALADAYARCQGTAPVIDGMQPNASDEYTLQLPE